MKRVNCPNGDLKRTLLTLSRSQVSEQLYVELLTELENGLTPGVSHTLDRLTDLPAYVELHDKHAIHSREAGDIDGYFRHNQLACLLKKLELPLFDNVGRTRALEKWMHAEMRCKEMNYAILASSSNRTLANAIVSVRKEIWDLLGSAPPAFRDVVRFMRFGPGSDLTHKRTQVSLPEKLINPSAYVGQEDLVSMLATFTRMRPFVSVDGARRHLQMPELAGDEVRYFEAARYDVVPKSISEMRSIEIGPSLTGFIQQGYDGFIRDRLRAVWKLDLRDQFPNQRLARIGSIRGCQANSPCTIDLSSASDSICYALVGVLLPNAWFHTLKRLRASKITLPDGNVWELHKFSSMGNALTFSLQTLIFAACVRAILRARGHEGAEWRVYGDDIIVPYRVYDDVVNLLELFGFTVNSKKSFKEGNFRESCGGDYLHGTDVRALYLKKPIISAVDVFKFCNLTQLKAMVAPIPASCYAGFFRRLLSAIPPHMKVYGDTYQAPDRCIWSRYAVKRQLTAVALHSETKVPENLAYESLLLKGSLPHPPLLRGKGLAEGYSKTALRTLLSSELSSTVLTDPRVIRTDTSCHVIRRKASNGLRHREVAVETLPFEPLLMKD